MVTLSMITMISSLMFMMTTHPLSMGAMLLMSTISVSLIIGFYNLNFWYSYLLFIIMIGGMLVLFAYMTSVASNEKFNFSIKMMSMFFILIILTALFMLIDSYLINLNTLNKESMTLILTFKLSLTKFINYPYNLIMFFLIIYLLMTLIAVVKITNITKGSLRQMN